MNDVQKLLCKYKLDTTIYFNFTYSTLFFQGGGYTSFNVFIGGEQVATGLNRLELYYYFVSLGWIDTLNAGPGNNTQIFKTPAYLLARYTNLQDETITIENDIIYITGEYEGEIYVASAIILGNYIGIDYTEEELNCITPQDLQVVYEFTHKYKETLAKSTKKITSQTSNNSNSTSSDCCEWGSIGGSIGNQSDLINYLNTIEKNLISVYDEGVQITNDLTSLKFLGAGVTATNSAGEVSVTIPGGGGGSGTIYPDTEIVFGDGTTPGGITSPDFVFFPSAKIFRTVFNGGDDTLSFTGFGAPSTRAFRVLINNATAFTQWYDRFEFDNGNFIISDLSGSGNGYVAVDNIGQLSWSSGTGGMSNPMTTGGDIIYGGGSGVPTRLANGSANQVLQSNGTTLAPSWVTLSTPGLQQVTDVNASTTNSFRSSDGLNNRTVIENGTIDMIKGGGNVTIDPSSATQSYTALLPDKPLGIDTFAMISDLTSFVAGVQYQGVWNASTNSPSLVTGVGTQGHYYVVSVSGATNLDGITDWVLGDWAIFNGSAWQKVDNTDAVVSVNGHIGAVVLDTDDVSDSTDKRYVTDANLTVINNTSGTNTGDNATNTTSNTYADGKVTDAIVDGVTTVAPSQNAVFDALALKASAQFVESISLQDGGTSIAATTYTIELYANYAYTINELRIVADAGTCTANLKIGATSVTGISAVAVSNSIVLAPASGANTVAVGDKITLVTTLNSGLNNLQLTIKTTRI
jgi:hypothetical protein